MDSRRLPEYTLEICADRSNMREVVKGVLHLIFFHRYLTPLHPATHEVLDQTLPYVSEDEVESLVDARTTSFLRLFDGPAAVPSSSSPATTTSTATTTTTTSATSATTSNSSTTSSPSRAHLVLHFLERKRKKGLWFVAKADEETVWETWVIDVSLLVVAGPRSTNPAAAATAGPANFISSEAAARKLMEQSLQTAAWNIVTIASRERAHIPPITTNETNPFPFHLLINPRPDNWAQKTALF